MMRKLGNEKVSIPIRVRATIIGATILALGAMYQFP